MTELTAGFEYTLTGVAAEQIAELKPLPGEGCER
jgi:hypothetical protein